MTHSVNEKATEAFKLHQKISELCNTGATVSIALGKFLSEIKKYKLYKYILGDERATWAAYLAQPEIGKSRTTADLYINIYEKMVGELGIPEERLIGKNIGSLRIIMRVINNENKTEWLERLDARMSRSDLDRLARYPGVDPMTCEHEWRHRQQRKCRKCGEVEFVGKFQTEPAREI